MENTQPLKEVPPSHPAPSCCSSSRRCGGRAEATVRYIYDDYGRELPAVRSRSVPRHLSSPELCGGADDKKKFTRSPLYIVICLAVVVFVVQLGASLADVPSTRLLEDIICRRHYNDYDSLSALIPEGLCLGNEVQSELNVISTGALIFGYLPGILMAIPYGSMADRHGRKSILGMCVLGMILSQGIWAAVAWNWRRWDLRYVWASSSALLIGGGESVAEAMVFAMITDVAPEEKRAVYFQVEICAVLLAETLAPFIASAMMTYSIWLPILISPVIMAVGGALIALIPETLGVRIAAELSRADSHQADGHNPTFSNRVWRYRQTPTFDLSTPWSRFRDSIAAIIALLKTADVMLLIPTASLTIPVATVAMGITLRYIPLRFGWTLTQTGMILGLRTGFNILVLLIFLPTLGHMICRRDDGRDRDLVLARVSVVLLVVGQVLLAAAPGIAVALAGLVVLTLGTGAPSLCRAALTRAAADGAAVGRLFGILAVCEAVGYLACGVGFGTLYQVGLGLGLGADGEPRTDGSGGSWLALVFYVAAVVYFWCGGLLWVVDVRGRGEAAAAAAAGDAESLRSDASSEKGVYEVRVLADGRVTRKCPSLESVSVAV